MSTEPDPAREHQVYAAECNHVLVGRDVEDPGRGAIVLCPPNEMRGYIYKPNPPHLRQLAATLLNLADEIEELT